MLSRESDTGRRYSSRCHRSSLGQCQTNCGARLSLWFRTANGKESGSIIASLAGVASRSLRGRFSRPLSMCFAPVANGKRYPGSMAARVPCMHIFSVGRGKAFSSRYGKPVWLNTTKWKALPGSGRASTGPRERHPWRPSAWAPTPRTGEKKGRKRSLLVDARGIPLSLVASGANVHDVKLLTITLDKMVCKRPRPRKGQPQRLCADAGYKGDPATKAVLARLYRPHIKQRKEEADAKRQKPGYKARRWVVERTHSWLNRFRKLLVSFEKTEASFVALLTLAAALICWRQIIVISG